MQTNIDAIKECHQPQLDQQIPLLYILVGSVPLSPQESEAVCHHGLNLLESQLFQLV
jgi:hypothetical protein